MFQLTSPSGKTYETKDPKEANDLVMLHGYRRAKPKSKDAEDGSKADDAPANKATQKPKNKAKN